MRPGYNKASLWFDAPHQLNEDLCITDWLEQQNQGYDVLTDQNPAPGWCGRACAYRVLITGSHPGILGRGRCWTRLKRSWPVVVGSCTLGGNGLYWGDHRRPRPAAHHRSSAWHHRHADLGARLLAKVITAKRASRAGSGALRDRPPQKLVGVGVHGARAGSFCALSPPAGEPRPARPIYL